MKFKADWAAARTSCRRSCRNTRTARWRPGRGRTCRRRMRRSPLGFWLLMRNLIPAAMVLLIGAFGFVRLSGGQERQQGQGGGRGRTVAGLAGTGAGARPCSGSCSRSGPNCRWRVDAGRASSGRRPRPAPIAWCRRRWPTGPCGCRCRVRRIPSRSPPLPGCSAGAHADADAALALDGRPGADPLDVESAQSAAFWSRLAATACRRRDARTRALVVVFRLLGNLGRLFQRQRVGVQFRGIFRRLADLEPLDLLRRVRRGLSTLASSNAGASPATSRWPSRQSTPASRPEPGGRRSCTATRGPLRETMFAPVRHAMAWLSGIGSGDDSAAAVAEMAGGSFGGADVGTVPFFVSTKTGLSALTAGGSAGGTPAWGEGS